ncbi:MAG: T6SS immunity protein Tdi1 domain-containing protein [Verrucomicrobiota bacterium]
MTINDLSVNFNHLDRDTLLSEWKWLAEESKRPIMITKAGDAFLQDTESMAVFFLDTVNGKLEEVAENGSKFQELLSKVDFVMDKFSVNLVAPLLKSGDQLPEGSLYGWKTLPVLGGEYSNENLEPTDIEVHFSITGQIWDQVKDLPPGTKIEDIQFE